jgi:hypothetical protein
VYKYCDLQILFKKEVFIQLHMIHNTVTLVRYLVSTYLRAIIGLIYENT